MTHGGGRTDGGVPSDPTATTGGVPSDPTATTGGGGVKVSTTDSIRSFLTAASTDIYLPEDLRDLSSALSLQLSVSYKQLRSIWSASDPSTRPDLLSLLSGSSFIFTSPKPREKSEELKARLRKLEEASERKAYEELVKDIAPSKGAEEPFSSYKDQLGFGLHVVLMMFTGYLVGYAAFRALFGPSNVTSAAGGIVGLVGGMLVETLLFIIRTSNQDPMSSNSRQKEQRFIPPPSKLKKNQ